MIIAVIVIGIIYSADAAITPLDASFSVIVGDDVTFPWVYDNEKDMFEVVWSYQSPSAEHAENIMTQTPGLPVDVLGGFDVVHNGNGNITLVRVTLSNSGTYFCTVIYSVPSGVSPATGTSTLVVTVSDMNVEKGITTLSDTGPERLTSVNGSPKSTDTALMVGIILGAVCIFRAVVSI